MMTSGRGAFARNGAAVASAIAVVMACRADEPGTRNASGGTPGATAAAARALAARASQRCDAPDVSLTIDSAGIGPVLRSARISALATRCAVRDTQVVLEGTSERAHAVQVGAHSLVVLTTGTADTSIIRVIATDPAFKTPGGVGVGSSVEALRLAHGRICAARGEGDFVVMAAELPGVSFAIDWSPPPSRDPAVAETPFPGGDPGTALDGSRLTKVWVHGVSGGCRVGVG